MSRIKAIFFDSAGVLVRNELTERMAEFEQAHNLSPHSLYPAAHDHPYWKELSLGQLTEQEYLDNVQRTLGHELDFDAFRQMIDDSFPENTELIPLLGELKEQVTLGIISNNPREWFDRLWKRSGWQKFFDVPVVSGNVGIRKPDEGIFAHALNLAGVEPDETVYIDDRPAYTGGATKLGMTVVTYESPKQLTQALRTILA